MMLSAGMLRQQHWLCQRALVMPPVSPLVTSASMYRRRTGAGRGPGDAGDDGVGWRSVCLPVRVGGRAVAAVPGACASARPLAGRPPHRHLRAVAGCGLHGMRTRCTERAVSARVLGLAGGCKQDHAFTETRIAEGSRAWLNYQVLAGRPSCRHVRAVAGQTVHIMCMMSTVRSRC